MSLFHVRSMIQAADIAGTPPFNQDFNLASGPGENPKCALYFITGPTADSGTGTATGRIGIGMTDGTTQLAIGMLWEDGVAGNVTDCEGRSDNATVIQFPGAGNNAINGEASWTQWNTNGSRLSWADALSGAMLIQAIYFFGSELQCTLTTVTTSASTNGTASITGLSHAPNFVFILGGANFTADETLNNANVGWGFAGMGRNGIEQGGSWVNGFDRALTNTSNAQSIYTTGLFRVATADNSGGGSSGVRPEVTSFNSDGLTITSRDSGAAIKLAALCMTIPKHRLWIGNPSALATKTTGNQTLYDANFKPKSYFFVGTRMATINTNVTAATAGQIGYGFANASEQITCGSSAQDNQATSNSSAFIRSDRAIQVPNVADGVDWSASHVSMDTLGPKINIDDASAAARQAVMAVFSDDPVSIPQLYTKSRKINSHRRRRIK